MSEYQYYEFQAVDRQLSAKEMAELRRYSSRALITPSRFTVSYSWGNFKGNEDAWMEKYFDAFVYLANWGTHVLKLRLPSRLLPLETARKYCIGDSAAAREAGGKVILSFTYGVEGGYEWIEEEEDASHLAAMLPLRAELARGDLRALYLGWLLCAQNRGLGGGELEPPVPPGLQQLSEPLRRLANFLNIDSSLLHIAAQTSAPLENAEPKFGEVHEWVDRLTVNEKNGLITSLIMDLDQSLILELRSVFLKERASGAPAASASGRTVGELLQAAEAYTAERERIMAENRAKEKARRDREAAIARTKHLDEITGRETELWTLAAELIETKIPKNYDQAVQILCDLRDLDARGKEGRFRQRFESLRQSHLRKITFIERLKKAGL